MAIPEFLFYKYRGGFKRIKLNEIFFLEADDNYVNVISLTEKHVIRATFDSIMSKLPPDKFVRTTRTYAVAIDHIDVFNKEKVTFLGVKDLEIPVGKRYFGELKARVKFIDGEGKNGEE